MCGHLTLGKTRAFRSWLFMLLRTPYTTILRTFLPSELALGVMETWRGDDD